MRMKGTYILLIKLSTSCKVLVGNLGRLKLKKGYYAYVGSALNDLDARISRHLKIKKRLHWHIDYLLNKGNVKNVFYKEGEKKEECEFANKLSRHFQSINNFGSSDCNCKSHLFYSRNYSQLRSAIVSLGTSEYGSVKDVILTGEEWQRIIKAVVKREKLGLEVVFRTVYSPTINQRKFIEGLITRGINIRSAVNWRSANLPYGVIEIEIENHYKLLAIWYIDRKNELISITATDNLDLSEVLDALASSNVSPGVMRTLSHDRFPNG